MKYGIEIECLNPMTRSEVATILASQGLPVVYESYNHNVSSHWKIVQDGSVSDSDLNGMEIVSPILDTENESDTLMVRKVCRALQKLGGKVNRTCGLHVHVDAAHLSGEQVRNVWERYRDLETEIDAFMPSNRRANVSSYTMTLRNKVVHGATKADLATSLDRYYKVNLQSLTRYGTIEFRQHNGTIDAEKILNWVSFCTQFVQASANGSAASEVQTVTRTVNRFVVPTNLNYGQRQIYIALMNAPHNNLTVSEISNCTNLNLSTVRAYISTMRSQLNVRIRPSYRGSNYICLVPNTISETVTETVQQTRTVGGIWDGISPEIRAYYEERKSELNGFIR
jgi:hypothetical protein